MVDMPFLPDGTPVDVVLNPLGIPSRMNVGQIFECLLGLAAEHLNKFYRVMPFDEMHSSEASRILINKKLKEASLLDKKSWIFNQKHPGKQMLIDGRSGTYFDNPITVGRSYMLKLIHLVDDKLHARSTGPYSLVTQQPLGGKAQHGGQRLGEMEVWALEAFGAAYTLQELLTVKSDDMDGRNEMLNAIVKGRDIPKPGIPESFKVLMRELQSLSLDISAYKVVSDGSQNFEATEVDLITPSKFNSITNSQQQSTDNLTDTVSSFNLTKDIMLRKTNDK
jgi:DNA-directed RNA polymerase subunit beta